jgi:hypothetical protein
LKVSDVDSERMVIHISQGKDPATCFGTDLILAQHRLRNAWVIMQSG